MFSQHLLSFGVFFAIMVGPIPLSLVLIVSVTEKKEKASFPHTILIILLRAAVGIFSRQLCRFSQTERMKTVGLVLTVSVVFGASFMAMSHATKMRDAERSLNSQYGEAVDYVDKYLSQGEKITHDPLYLRRIGSQCRYVLERRTTPKSSQFAIARE